MKVYDKDGNEVLGVVGYLPIQGTIHLNRDYRVEGVRGPSDGPFTVVEDDGTVVTAGNAPCDAVFGKARSPRWGVVRRVHLAKFPDCLVCGATKDLNVHHVKPFHLFPELELEPSNLVTLCESPSHNCHFFIGHLLNWRSYNESVTIDAALIRERVRCRP